MQPLNPFLRAFFRSALPSQCSPINQHVLLVPTTEVLLNAKDRESNSPYAELVTSEEFLGSHVLRVPNGSQSGNTVGEGGNVREQKGKAKQYTTINGRTVIVKDAFVYSNKGYKTLNQAQLLQDIIYYPDTLDGQQWLVYYISRPLMGSYQATPVIPAVISDEPSKERRKLLAEASETTISGAGSPPLLPKKKDVKSFADLLNQFPMISRQMQPGLERIIRDFVAINDKPVQKPRSRRSSVSSQTPSVSSSVASIKSSLSGSTTVHPTALELEPEEETIRTSLETAITAAIDLFQQVDKQQLSLLGANTELTGPVVERMIERYVAEQVHDQTVFPKVCAVRKADDSDLDSKIRKMSDIDIAQVGIPVEDGMKGKRELADRLAKGGDAFKRMGVASSAQEMLEILLATQKAVTDVPNSGADSGNALTVNADILVSMLLVVVIRSGVRHLHSRLLYMRYFIFTDDVESGEQGYALATLEAVLNHLTNASHALRKASKRNKQLWQASRGGDVQALEAILQPSIIAPSEDAISETPDAVNDESSEDSAPETLHLREEAIKDLRPSEGRMPEFAAVNGSLGHVFPFQRPPTPPPEQTSAKMKKRVSMASLPRSQSQSSGYSSRSHSRKRSIDSTLSLGPGGDLSSEKLAQTQDPDGNSVLMMAVDGGQVQALRFLLSIPAHFRAEFVLDDGNNAGTTLLSAAVQSGNRAVADELLEFLRKHTSDEQLQQYLAVQDAQGRCVAHYLFNQPHLIQRFGKKLPWRLKDMNGQTPLFALCRSYDHRQYHTMVDSAMSLAAETQGDGEPLHLDDHLDAKGNTLLHVVVDTQMMLKLLRHCDADVNAANDKRFTPLMVGSKYGRIDLVRVLFGDPRVDTTLRDLRGLSAVELAKDDDVRNRIDDLVLLSRPPGKDGRTTTVVRSFFVEDGTVRFVLKSGAQNTGGSITVTTCRRTVTDFENLANWLRTECQASWLPVHFNLPSPFLIPSKPSRAVLRDAQIRLDNFFCNLLTHGTFATHELVWEFFLVPELDARMLTERSKRKAELRVEHVKDDFEPVPMEETQEVENFVAYAKDQIRGMTMATRKAMRSVNKYRMTYNDLSEAQGIASSRLSTVLSLPPVYGTAFERYSKALVPTDASPWTALFYSLHSVVSSSTAIQVALNRPAYLIGSMTAAQRNIDRSLGSISRTNRWTPNIGLFDDAKKAVAVDAWDKAGKARGELENLGCELRYTQQTVASELAVWQDEHVKAGQATLRRFAKDMVVREKARLENLKRALRGIRKQSPLPAI
ncbi:hypothetical protein BAUCODRAFT_29304 [Baudoinia panamericana UAMH 10762]|uniref:VPS9 domain-containing protein n=1 Tax=Baudoinia panamericana (strain UAMH 10762) TaxID=717646 RepID=M2M1J4_BAUPA|nr:uncharacterized protein BAUCODRAFT_29304 [Baudoinia panamericana UAMH 10762]EMD00923.1 hypothetical protein BAUCODRAFT_29304 [Baudoinia panamericana UAMH 10762]